MYGEYLLFFQIFWRIRWEKMNKTKNDIKFNRKFLLIKSKQ